MREIIYDALSLGWGVQSSALAFMAGMDKIPRPDAVYFAELWNEGDEVYEYQEYATPLLKNLGIEVKIVDAGNILDHIMSWDVSDRVSMIPVWFLNPNDGKRQPLNRQCTGDFKIENIARQIRKDLGVKKLKRNTIRVWQGISIDEIKRAKKGALFPESFRVNHFPFIGQYANITYPKFQWESYSRDKIIEKIFKANGLRVPPKSSCFFCPFHDLDMWYNLFLKAPNLWEKACLLDESIRYYNTKSGSFQNSPFYLYEGLIPLREIDFDNEYDKKKKGEGLFSSGCESGFCFM